MAELTSTTPLAAAGKVIRVNDNVAVFIPTGTNYELFLETGGYNGPLNVPVRCIIRAKARKVYTVPSGGNFISPIFGPPRIVQGRVRAADVRMLVVHAAVPFNVDLPAVESGIDLDDGPVTVGRMVNVVCEPGVWAEFL